MTGSTRDTLILRSQGKWHPLGEVLRCLSYAAPNSLPKAVSWWLRRSRPRPLHGLQDETPPYWFLSVRRIQVRQGNWRAVHDGGGVQARGEGGDGTGRKGGGRILQRLTGKSKRGGGRRLGWGERREDAAADSSPCKKNLQRRHRKFRECSKEEDEIGRFRRPV